MKLILKSCITCILLVLSLNIQAQDQTEGRYVVQLKSNSTLQDLEEALQFRSNFKIVKPLSLALNIYLVQDQSKQYAEADFIFLARLEEVLRVERDAVVATRQIPDDPAFFSQWDMNIIEAPRTWDITTGGKTIDGDEIVVAVIDSGYDINNVDLTNNVFRNEADQDGDMNNDGCPGNCGEDDDMDGLIDEDNFGREPGDPGYDASFAADDDENGYIDDYEGLHAKSATDDHPYSFHGTGVAGIIGAEGNNGLIMAGVNHHVKMLLISGATFQSEIIESYNYISEFREKYNSSAGANGAFVVATNFSAGIDFAKAADFPIWCGMYDIMGQHGILSAGATTNKDVDVDEQGDMPSTCTSKYLITVTNTNASDQKVTSGYGDISIDLGAPGEGGISLDADVAKGYEVFGGTSGATPHVAGAIGLIYSAPCQSFLDYFKNNPSKVDSLKTIILNATDPLNDLDGITVSGGRLNLYESIQGLNEFCGGTVGDLAFSSIKPNPVDDILYIEYETPDYFLYRLTLVNSLGQTVWVDEFNPPFFGEKRVQVNVSDLPHGVYFLSLRENKSKIVQKIVVAH